MKLTSLNWLSESAKEAELTITDGTHSVAVFCHPCEYNISDIIKKPLHVFMASDIMLTDSTETNIERTSNELGSFIIAKLENIDTGICAVGDIKFQLEDEMPSGIKSGDMIEFKCDRVDLW